MRQKKTQNKAESAAQTSDRDENERTMMVCGKPEIEREREINPQKSS